MKAASSPCVSISTFSSRCPPSGHFELSGLRRAVAASSTRSTQQLAAKSVLNSASAIPTASDLVFILLSSMRRRVRSRILGRSVVSASSRTLYYAFRGLTLPNGVDEESITHDARPSIGDVLRNLLGHLPTDVAAHFPAPSRIEEPEFALNLFHRGTVPTVSSLSTFFACRDSEQAAQRLN